ncbi:hypothetical protein [Mycolicibacterium houstonense]|uniref:hypothetical protein n=1 Tax=Mycolicibacterium houstonense TaxID=146021 RepID=UPI00082D87E2|nr:hypothetical protein [Mycolicibacterium houstonense]
MTDHIETIIAEHRPYGLDCKCGRPINSDADWAWHLKAELKAARIAVVQLPTWESLEDDYAVDFGAEQVRQYDPSGFGAYRVFDFGEIPSLSAALLAALADAAEESR